jgi:dihydrofolate synthase / folylpolyglutamate synthase
MQQRSLAEWLRWQETLNPLEIDLGLDRVRKVADRLDLQPPLGSVFLIAGTNGKGSVVNTLQQVCYEQGLVTGTYTSPHLSRYNERVCISGRPVADAEFVAAFDAIEAVRGELPLTYFEFGTLAAFWILSRSAADVWIIEVGLGGRLDATNILEPDFSLITTIDFDHQAFLGNTLEAIAAEKAGILRATGHGFFGDTQVPLAISAAAERLHLKLQRQGHEFGFVPATQSWAFYSQSAQLQDLPLPPGSPAVQLQNQSLALAALAAWRPELLADVPAVRRALKRAIPPGRFQVHNSSAAGGVSKALEWVLDVGHNPQALSALSANVAAMPHKPMTVVLGMLADKDVTSVVSRFAGLIDCWIVTDVGSQRGQTAEVLAAKLSALGLNPAIEPELDKALLQAIAGSPEHGRILVFGSFFVVGPAMEWLGL